MFVIVDSGNVNKMLQTCKSVSIKLILNTKKLEVWKLKKLERGVRQIWPHHWPVARFSSLLQANSSRLHYCSYYKCNTAESLIWPWLSCIVGNSETLFCCIDFDLCAFLNRDLRFWRKPFSVIFHPLSLMVRVQLMFAHHRERGPQQTDQTAEQDELSSEPPCP